MTDQHRFLPPGAQVPANPADEPIALDFAIGGDEELDDPRFVESWRIVKRKWKFIATTTGICVAAAAAYALLATPLYTAESKILIERRTPQVLDVRELLADGMAGDESNYYRTQEQILRSRALATDVIRDMSLDHNAYFLDPDAGEGGLQGWFHEASDALSRVFGGGAEPRVDASGIPPEVYETYREDLSVTPVTRTRLAIVRFTTPDANLSAEIVNQHVKAYIQQGLKLRTAASREAVQFLEGKLEELKSRLNASETALNAYRRDKGILSLDDKENIVVDRLSDLNDLLSQAEAERIGLEAQVKLIQHRDYDALPEVSRNTLIQTIKGQLATIETEYAELSSQFKPTYPAVQQAKAQVREMKGRLETEIKRVVGSIESQYLAAVDNEKALRAKMDEQKTEVLALKDASVQYALLKRETDANRDLYDNVLARIKEIGVAASVQASNVSVIDAAVPPVRPSSPRRVRALLLALVAGLLASVGWVLGREFLDGSLKSPEDVERHLRLPNLGIVPDFEALPENSSPYGPSVAQIGTSAGIRDAGRGEQQIQIATPNLGDGSLVVSEDSFSVATESYRTLRTAILFSQPESSPQTLMFTSAMESEGKTTSALNTAIVFAKLGARVLVVDADLRRATCHKRLQVGNQVGLAEVLTGQRDFDDVTRKMGAHNVHLLSAGRLPPNPTELLGSRAMAHLIEQAQQKFDYIIIDSPPVMAVNDAVVISPMVDGVVMVVKAHATPRQILKRAEARLLQARAKILGVLLNKVDTRSDQYSTYYGGNYYSSYYAAEEPLAQEM